MTYTQIEMNDYNRELVLEDALDMYREMYAGTSEGMISAYERGED